jgi:apolipoprotein N-acyltransferase
MSGQTPYARFGNLLVLALVLILASLVIRKQYKTVH